VGTSATLHILNVSCAALMQATVAGLKPDVDGSVVVGTVGCTIVDVVVRGSEVDGLAGFIVVEVTVGRTVVDVVVVIVVVLVVVVVVVVVGVRVVVVVACGSGRLAQLVRQAPKAARHCASGVGCAHPLEHAAKAAVISAMQVPSPRHRGLAVVHAF